MNSSDKGAWRRGAPEPQSPGRLVGRQPDSSRTSCCPSISLSSYSSFQTLPLLQGETRRHSCCFGRLGRISSGSSSSSSQEAPTYSHVLLSLSSIDTTSEARLYPGPLPYLPSRRASHRKPSTKPPHNYISPRRIGALPGRSYCRGGLNPDPRKARASYTSTSTQVHPNSWILH